jgi:hypothetical protein
MATSAHHLESSKHRTAPLSYYERLDLDDDRIMIDIETEMAIHSQMESRLEKPTQRITHILSEGRTLGPLAVLLILALYALLSPLLSPAIHEYIYRILH